MLRELRARTGLLLMKVAVRLLGPEVLREALGEPDWSEGLGPLPSPEEQRRLEEASFAMGRRAREALDGIAMGALGVETRVSTPPRTPAYSPTEETARVVERYAPRRRAEEPQDEPPLRGSLEARRAERG